jgi:ribosome biogenesis GTPase / thiamine phosphate phosphatase
MHHDVFDRLQPIGLTPALMRALAALAPTSVPGDPGSCEPARVTEVHRETAVLHNGLTEFSARLHRRLATALSIGDDAIAVGDWVLAQRDAGGMATVVARAEPQSRIIRRDADGLRHVVVSNVDTAFLVMGLDGDFNPRRIERYVALVSAAGAGVLPVVVLTKRDWAGEAVANDETEALQRRLGQGVPVHAVDGTAPATAQILAPYLRAGQTAVLLGSSGAGKSTLTNTLLGRAVQDTGAVRATDSRGKHTTTARSLHRLPTGGCVIDTPGVRTLRPDLDAEALAVAFNDIDALAAQCRFRDCRHQDEPGCAVRAAVDPDRLGNWHKLGRELRRDSMNALERRQQLSQWKARTREGRARAKSKRGE